MIKLGDKSTTKLDLTTANILIVEENVNEQDILAQVLMGFGVPGIQRRATADEVMIAVKRESFDLALISSKLKDMSGYDLVMQLRRQEQTSIKHMPIMLVCGHMQLAGVKRARDCGANFVLTKPISPQILFDRIVWLAQDHRQFIEADSYIGPDRRFKAFGPPVGMKGRRADDLSAHIGEAKEDNMSQDLVDGFFGAKKVSL
jgi:DNA-binding response OmpR family regulator